MKKIPPQKVRPQRKPTDLKKLLFTRFMLIVAVFILWIAGIGVRLVHLQVNQHEILLTKARNQRINIKKTKMMRGTIFDRNGSYLAISERVKTLFANPMEIEDVKAAAKSISRATGLNMQKLVSQLTEAKAAEKQYLPIKKRVDADTEKKINKALYDAELKKGDEPRYAGLHWDEDQKRTYPYGSVGSTIVGLANGEDQGVAGIEQSQNEILEGPPIKTIQERDRLGRVFDETVTERESPQDVVLTIDKNIQFITDEALAQGVVNAGARAGMAVVLDPKTGEILALANAPSFDPDNLRSGANDTSNRLVQSVYSPGSVFKLVTYGAALEKKLFRPSDMIDAGNGTIEVAGHKFTDSHHVGRVTYAEALAHSSNVCAIKTGMRVGKEDFYSMVQKMGFGRRTGIELPAETAGLVRKIDRWNGDSLASMSIGYEIGVTPLQIAAAFATIANDGIKNQPHIIKEIRDSEGKKVSVTEPNQMQVVSAETAKDLRVMLRQVVLSGTGRRAQLDGYSSAGKTGTAWKFDPKTRRVERSKYMSTFVGFAPADDPKYVIAVVMDEPKAGARDGGTVSAPVFRDIAQQLLEAGNVPRDLEVSTDTRSSDDVPEVNNGDTPTIKGPPVEKEKGALEPRDRKTHKTVVSTPNGDIEANIIDKSAILRRDIALAATTSPEIWKTKPKI